MEDVIKNYFHLKPKRLKFNSTCKIKTQFKQNKKFNNINTINNKLEFPNIESKKNKLDFPNIESIKNDNIPLQTEYSTIHSKLKLNPKKKLIKKRAMSVNTKSSKIITEKESKQFLRGKLRYLIKNNIILCEKKFNPKSFTESISNVHFKEYKNRFKNINTRNKVGIFTNKYPSILNNGNKFYTRYFDYFISPDELLNKNFNKNEIFQIKTDPNYFNFGKNYNNVSFFKKKTLKEILNEEEKIGANKIMDISLKKSLKQTKKRIGEYLNYYTSVMSRQGFIGN